MDPSNTKPKDKAETPRGRLNYIVIRLEELKAERERLVEERRILREKILASKGANPGARQD